jgi:hypothetical protein
MTLQHGYHDAMVREIKYRDDESVIFEVDLCGCCNPSSGTATLSFHGIRNFEEVKEKLEFARKWKRGDGYLDEIVGILRERGRGYLIDMMTVGAVIIDARGIHEA